MLRDIQRGDDEQLLAVRAVLLETQPDVLVLAEFDGDYDNLAISAFAEFIAVGGLSFPYRLSFVGNNGKMTPYDLDQNGRTGEPRDAMGYGRFHGDGGLAILSRWPLGPMTDLDDLLWKDIPGASLPPGWPDNVNEIQKLSSTTHTVLPVQTDQGQLTLLAFAATPPVFDGPEDRNGLRNGDEIRLWKHVLAGELGGVPNSPVVIGKANLDPVDGEGVKDAIADLLVHPLLQDPMPESEGGAVHANDNHLGDPALDTADWPDDGPGNLRVSYILPPADWQVFDAGVFWPAPEDPLSELLGSDGLAAGPHRLVWVDIGR